MAHCTEYYTLADIRQILLLSFVAGAVSALVMSYLAERLWSLLARHFRIFDRRS